MVVLELLEMMKIMKYPPVDEESESAMLDSCGTLSNIIAGRFKSEISQNGYVELEMSHFWNYRNNAFNGVAFPESEYHDFEFTCMQCCRKDRKTWEVSKFTTAGNKENIGWVNAIYGYNKTDQFVVSPEGQILGVYRAAH